MIEPEFHRPYWCLHQLLWLAAFVQHLDVIEVAIPRAQQVDEWQGGRASRLKSNKCYLQFVAIFNPMFLGSRKESFENMEMA